MPRGVLKFLFAALFVAALLVSAPTFAAGPAWSGTGPFPPGNGSDRVNALLLDSATGVLYAGTGSGTVFVFQDASLSQPPVAMDDSAETNENTAVAIDILGNDFDPEGALDASSVVVQNEPAHGAASARFDGSVTYVPANDFVGVDSFTYIVPDAAGLTSGAATVSIDVQAAPSNGAGGNGGGSGGDIGGDDGGTNPPPASHFDSGGGGAWGLFGLLLLGALPWRRFFSRR